LIVNIISDIDLIQSLQPLCVVGVYKEEARYGERFFDFILMMIEAIVVAIPQLT